MRQAVAVTLGLAGSTPWSFLFALPPGRVPSSKSSARHEPGFVRTSCSEFGREFAIENRH
jgi:hypothetical protein